MATDSSESMRGKAYQLCREYLLGAWKLIGQDTMVLRQISGGLSNHLYYCALPSTQKPLHKEPREVLLRVYGQMHGEDALENMLAESVIFTLLSERGLGPHLYGVFPGGRIEQYINARSLYREELSDPDLSQQIATKAALVHALDVPISKTASWLWSSIEKWLKSSESLLVSSTQDPSLVNKLRDFDARAELLYVKSLVCQLQCPVVFGHNDLQEGNVLLQNTKNGNKVALIDFEYCAYNYRSFDIANHFSERVYGYRNTSHPYFSVHLEDYPDRDQQLLFIRKYLTEYNKGRAESSEDTVRDRSSMTASVAKWFPVDLPEEEKVLKEVQCFNLAGHLFWILWSIVQGHVSTIQFGYLDYALQRIEHYQQQRTALQREIEQASSSAS